MRSENAESENAETRSENAECETFACSRKSLSRNPRSTELTKISDRPGIRFSLKSAYMTKNLSECEQRSQNWLSFPSAEL